MMFKPVELKYRYSDLEPFIDEETMRVHYEEHYLGYTKKLNELLKKNRIRQSNILTIIEDALIYPQGIQDNAGGYYNHSLFWEMLSPKRNESNNDNEPYGVSREIINRDFGGYAYFVEQIKNKAKERFGSGWVWWILNPDGTTDIVQTPYQDNPKMYDDVEILLGIDVWEHAYYLKHQAKRMEYIDDILRVVNWNYPNKVLKIKYY
jgi:Fe-Mn family superoxide dismutase